MSKIEHTPEPWFVFGECEDFPGIEGDNGKETVVVYGAADQEEMGIQGKTHKARYKNARRIVACVNACTGFSTEELENGVIEKLLERMKLLDNETSCS